MITQRQPPHFMRGNVTPDALAHFIRAALTMPRRANDNNPNMPTFEG